MRILHSSDWHIGRTFHGESVRDHLAMVLGEIPDLVRERNIDVVLVAGDIFDSTTPPSWAFDYLSDLLIEIREAGAVVIVSSGNHDSAERLRFLSPLAAHSGVHIAANPLAPVRAIEIEDAHGPVRFYPIPYLEPSVVRTRAGADGVRSQREAIEWALSPIREDLAAHPARSVALAHVFAAGIPADVPGADLERDLSAGGLDVVPTGLFDIFNYTALGHIHSNLRPAERIRYSGAPLHYSFSETGAPRGAWIIDLDAAGDADIEWFEFQLPRALHRITGELETLLTSAELAMAESSWVQATLTDEDRPVDAMRKLRARFPYVAQILYAPPTRGDAAAPSYTQLAATALSDEARVMGFLAHIRNGHAAASPEQQKAEAAAVAELIDQQRVREAAR